MKLVILLALVIIVISEIDEEMLNKFKADIESLAVNIPTSENKLASNIMCAGDLKFDSFSLSETSKIDDYNIPPEAKKLFKGIIFSNVNIQSFNYAQGASNDSIIYEFVGIAKKNKGIVYIAYINVAAFGKLITVYSDQEFERCEGWWIFKKCWLERRQVPRGYTMDEINSIKMQLRSEAYFYLKNKLDQGKYTLFNEYEISYDFIVTKTELMSTDNKYYKEFVKEYDNIVNSLNVTTYENITEENVDKFIIQFKDIQQFPNEDEFVEVSIRKLKHMCNRVKDLNSQDFTSNIYSDVVRFAYEHDKVIHFYEIKVTHNEVSKTFIFYVKTLSINISFFEDFMIFKTSNQVNYDLGLDKNELLLISESIIAAYDGNNYKSLIKKKFQPVKTKFIEFLPYILNDAKIANKKNINSIHSKFEQLTKSKVNEYYSNTKLQSINSVYDTGFEEYIMIMSRRLGISEGDINEVVEGCRKKIDSKWNSLHLTYTDNRERQRMASFVISKNDNDTYNIYTISLDKVVNSSKVFVIRSQELDSTEGNIISIGSGNFNEKEVNTLFDFMNALVVKKVYENFLK